MGRQACWTGGDAKVLAGFSLMRTCTLRCVHMILEEYMNMTPDSLEDVGA